MSRLFLLPLTKMRIVLLALALAFALLPSLGMAQNVVSDPNQCGEGYNAVRTGAGSIREGTATYRCEETEPGTAIGRSALALIDYSLGYGNGNNCFTCTFTQQFLIALSSFSAAVFMYFRAFFVTLMPLVMAIWIAWSVGRIMIAGGEGGAQFFASMVRKLTLFFLLWLVMMADSPPGNQRNPSLTMTVEDSHRPWVWFGPFLLEYGMDLANEVRVSAATNLSVNEIGVNNQMDMNCVNIAGLNPVLAAEPDTYAYAYSASEMSCAIERIHIIGIAAGLAMIEGAYSSFNLSFNGVVGTIVDGFTQLFNAMISAIFGLIVIITFALSMIWFVFLVLDVVVKVLIIAAISPILMIFALLVPTRQYALSAVRQSVGGVATLLGLAFISALAFYLIANVVEVYNTSRGFYGENLPAIENTSTVGGLRNFISGIQIEAGQDGHIPMNETTPWFHYLLLCSLSIFALGKKVIKIIEGIVGTHGMSTMADSAKQIAVTGSSMGLASAYFMSKGTMWGMGKGARLGVMTHGAAQRTGSFINTIRKDGFASAYSSDKVNPFGNMGGHADSVLGNFGKSKAGDPGIMRRTMDINRSAQEGINSASGDTPGQQP